MNGTHRIDLTNEQERITYLESIGGEENLKNKFPLLYRSFLDVCDSNDDIDNVNVVFHSHDFNCERTNPDEDAYRIRVTLKGDYIDKNHKLSDTKNQPDTFTVYIKGEVVSLAAGGKQCINISEIYKNTNSTLASFSSELTYPSAMFSNLELQFSFVATILSGKTNRLSAYKYEDTKTFDSTILPYDMIHVDDPVERAGLKDNLIHVLYGRDGPADYKYIENNKDSLKLLRTILPIKGYVQLKEKENDENYSSFTRLTPPPDPPKHYVRSALNYNNSEWVIYQKNLSDEHLYQKMNNNANFNVVKKDKGDDILYFDLFNPDFANDLERRYDWGSDITDKAVFMDQKCRVCKLVGQFSYDIKMVRNGVELPLPEHSILIYSADKSELDDAKRKYYEFKSDSNTVYIPPIYIWWGCHAKDNKISLADGIVKHAEEIKEGDILPCFGGKNLEVDNIYKGHEDSIFQVTTKHGEKTKISRGHPLLLEGGMGMEVERLNSGDRILMDGNTSAEVESVELIPYNDKVFNFTFKDEEGANYLVADGFYSGDFYAQNMLPIPKRPITKHHAAIIEEMRRLAENI